ncbi:hypothetical protein [Streptomyces sp. NPDC013187]|uniref:hypothetical protein n=1 Tax=Streptomyces sp. NPDC013187 TaxID=3364865 RepID=UPI0036BE3FB2
MSDNALRSQPDPTNAFDMQASSQRADTDLWEAFHAAQGAEPSGAGAGRAPQTDEQLPAADDPLDLRPLHQQFRGEERSGEQRLPDPPSAFGDAPMPSLRGETDGVSNHRLPPGEDPVDLRPLRIRFQEGEH